MTARCAGGETSLSPCSLAKIPCSSRNNSLFPQLGGIAISSKRTSYDLHFFDN